MKDEMKTNNNLSANTLFHFTKSKDNLIGILTNEFHPKYSYEYFCPFSGYKDEVTFRMPMVSFCDIQLSHIKINHTKYYGEYGIGLEKKWGISKGINPILYAQSNSLLFQSFIDSLFKFIGKRPLAKDENNTYFSSLKNSNLYLLMYLKPYEGKMFRDGKLKKKNYRFYDEREWRYVPTIAQLKDNKITPFIVKNDYDIKKIENYETRLKEQCRLGFEPKNIKYIIIKRENEILEIFDRIQIIKEKYSEKDRKLLRTRIISMEQIKNDF